MDLRVIGILVGVACTLLVACGSGDEAPGDARPFVGGFVFEEGVLLATCAGEIAARDLAGTEIGIEQRGAGQIEVIAGEDCRLSLRVRGDGASNQGEAGCHLSIRSVVLAARFRQFHVALGGDESLDVSGSGTADAVIVEQPLRCDPFEISGTLVRQAVP